MIGTILEEIILDFTGVVFYILGNCFPSI